MISVQDKMQELVKAVGSQHKLAALAKVKQPSVHDWLKGRCKPSLPVLLRLERAGLIKASEIRPELFV